MVIVAPGMVCAEDLSTGWLETVHTVLDGPGQKMFHTVTKIASPLNERQVVREAVDRLLAASGRQSLDTVANTIFPAAMAASSADPADLVRRYRALYSKLRQFSANRRGTYFGRIVNHPDLPAGDQLALLIAKLRTESSARAPKGARYEVSIGAPEDLPVFARRPTDTVAMGFPCLSMCSFHLDGGQLHLLATYRYEYLIERGYGNYVGLSRLQRYVAEQAGLVVGQMTVVAGRAHVDEGRRRLKAHLGSPTEPLMPHFGGNQDVIG